MQQYWERMDTEREAWVMPQELRAFKVKVSMCLYVYGSEFFFFFGVHLVFIY